MIGSINIHATQYIDINNDVKTVISSHSVDHFDSFLKVLTKTLAYYAPPLNCM